MAFWFGIHIIYLLLTTILRIYPNTMSSLKVTYQPPQDVVADDTLSATRSYRPNTFGNHKKF
jgi:hypothetical protein